MSDTDAKPVKKRVRIRRSKGDPAKRESRMYFNTNTQKAIVAYQTETSSKERERLYVSEILPAYNKLVENLINIHKFTGLHDSYEDLKSDCVNFLFETIRKFDGNRGTNAFSYFNVVAKNWLIIKTKQKTTRIKRNISIDDPDAMNATEHKLLDDHYVVAPKEVMFEKERVAHDVIELMYDVRSNVKTENELACVNAIITVFENINDIDLLNKSAVLLYMRELSGLSPKQLTTTMQVIKKLYRKVKGDAQVDFPAF